MDLDQAILQIVKEARIPDQQSFLLALKAHGIHVNQSTLSRHFKKLGIRKRKGAYHLVEPEYPGASRMGNKLPVEVVVSPPHLLALKTLPGHANAIGYRLETLRIGGIAGTVAGDDTLLVALSHPEKLDDVRRRLNELFGNKSGS